MCGLVGKKAFKNKGFFSGIIGVIQLNASEVSKYNLVYKDGSKNGFNKENEITIVEE